MMGNEYYKIDSLMYARMSECRMMNRGTEGISSVFEKMQILRLEHRAMQKDLLSR